MATDSRSTHTLGCRGHTRTDVMYVVVNMRYSVAIMIRCRIRDNTFCFVESKSNVVIQFHTATVVPLDGICVNQSCICIERERHIVICSFYNLQWYPAENTIRFLPISAKERGQHIKCPTWRGQLDVLGTELRKVATQHHSQSSPSLIEMPNEQDESESGN